MIQSFAVAVALPSLILMGLGIVATALASKPDPYLLRSVLRTSRPRAVLDPLRPAEEIRTPHCRPASGLPPRQVVRASR